MVGIIALGSATAACAQNNKAAAPPAPATVPAPAAPAAPAPEFSDLQLVEEFGWYVSKSVGFPDLGFNPAEVEALAKGVSAAASGKESPYTLQKIGPAMDQFMQKKKAIYMARAQERDHAASEKNHADSAAYFAKLAENKNVVALPDGLRYEIVKPGQGDYPKATDKVRVNYTGKLINGTVFDSSIQRGQPAEFGLNQVIPGWTEGLQKINKGGKIRLYVPSELAYGDQGQRGEITPGSTLIFDVELLDIVSDAPPAAPAIPKPASAGK